MCLGGFFVTQIGALFNGQRGVLVFAILRDGIGDAGQQQDGQHDVQFILQAQEGAVSKGNNETKRLPHAVVGKGCFLVPREEDAIQSCRTESEGRKSADMLTTGSKEAARVLATYNIKVWT